MSTCLINDAGETVAIRFFGGKERGPMADVNMPESIAKTMGRMMVHEDTSPDLQTTLSGWIADMKNAGRTVRYGQASAVVPKSGSRS